MSGLEFLRYSPDKFHELAGLIDRHRNEKKDPLLELLKRLHERETSLVKDLETLAAAVNAMSAEIRSASKQLNPFKPVEELEDESNELLGKHPSKGFLGLSFEVIQKIRGLFASLEELARSMNPPVIRRPGNGSGNVDFWSLQNLQTLDVILRMNGPAMERYFGALFGSEGARKHVINCCNEIAGDLDTYYASLQRRHTSGGMEVHINPVMTDVALAIYENVDLNGEIDGGTDPDKVSAYTMRRGQVLARAIDDNPLNKFVRNPGLFIAFIESAIREAWIAAGTMAETAARFLPAVREHIDSQTITRQPSLPELEMGIQTIRDLDPQMIKYREASVLLSSAEKFLASFMNETLHGITGLIMVDDSEPSELIKYIIARKAELYKHNRDENSFYVCKIGAGNKLRGIPPGSLEVVPGDRPKVTLDEVVGSGFDEIRKFVLTIESSARWHDLFVATSPSKSADKSNVLLIGPMGVGKTEIMRAVGADRGSISVFAQGSDFLTCWMGEAEKNPKRLFESAVRLQKESNRHVHLLIDEVDSVMKRPEDRKHGELDLTLEFQILMDGIVNYPNVTLWGATNSPGRIPMPLVRRFSKVVIVGELDIDDRVKLLRQFLTPLPSAQLDDRTFLRVSERLDGATGDVIRKVIDHIWRQKMDEFVRANEQEAKSILQWLNTGEKFDVRKLDPKKKIELKERLGKYFSVTPKDLEDSVDVHLKNSAIRAEIDTAKTVFRESKELMLDLSKGKIEVARA